MKKTTLLGAFATVALASGAAYAGTLDDIKERGKLNCGVTEGTRRQRRWWDRGRWGKRERHERQRITSVACRRRIGAAGIWAQVLPGSVVIGRATLETLPAAIWSPGCAYV